MWESGEGRQTVSGSKAASESKKDESRRREQFANRLSPIALSIRRWMRTELKRITGRWTDCGEEN